MKVGETIAYQKALRDGRLSVDVLDQLDQALRCGAGTL